MNPLCIQQAPQTGFAIRKVRVKPFLRVSVGGRSCYISFDLRIRCVARPDQAQALLLQRLGLRLPERLRPPPSLLDPPSVQM